MHYEEQSRRLSILGGFALGIACGAGAALLLAGSRRAPASDAVRRARALRGRRSAAARAARKKFTL
jgi:hypothetical protein